MNAVGGVLMASARRRHVGEGRDLDGDASVTTRGFVDGTGRLLAG